MYWFLRGGKQFKVRDNHDLVRITIMIYVFFSKSSLKTPSPLGEFCDWVLIRYGNGDTIFSARTEKECVLVKTSLYERKLVLCKVGTYQVDGIDLRQIES